MVINKRQSSTFRQGVQTVMIDIYGKFYSQNNDATYTYCINLVEAIIRHQKLLLTCIELPTVTLSYHVKIRKNYYRLEEFSKLTDTNVSWKIKV